MLNVRKSGLPSWLQQKFYIIDVPGPAILGLPTCELLGLVKLNVDAIKRKLPDLSTPQPDTKPKGAYQAAPPGTKINLIDDLKYWYPDCFDGIGSFKGETTLHLKANAEPFIDPPRRCPIHLRDKIKAELDNMEQKGIIRKVDTHTDWCSSLTYAIKQDGSLRVCLDPQKLNKSLKRCPHKIPTIEEITPAFSKAKFFTKLDAKAGYWSVKLAPNSQMLTTFHSPFGKYCFQRLAFGLSVSQDVFQQHMDRITSQCEGLVGISDDLVIYAETKAEHDRRLIAFLDVARKEGLKLNSKKCTIKTTCIAFLAEYTRTKV